MIKENIAYERAKKTYLKDRWVRDHLPFGFELNRIAA